MTSDTPTPAQEAHVEALGEAMCFANRKPHMYQEQHNAYAYGPCVAHAEAARWLLASDWLAAFVAERQAEALALAANELPCAGPRGLIGQVSLADLAKVAVWLRSRIGGAS